MADGGKGRGRARGVTSRQGATEDARTGTGLRAPGLFSGYGDFGTKTTGGVVVRLNRDSKKGGASAFEATGMRIASSRDFRETALPVDLDGADMVVFERFGIAVMDSDPDRISAAMTAATAERSILGHRAERVFRALGYEMDNLAKTPSSFPIPTSSADFPVPLSREYLAGYLSGVSGLVAHMLGQPAGTGAMSGSLIDPATNMASTIYNENSFTWGLQATNVLASRHTGRGIRVAVLDTGIDLLHPDFAGRVASSKSFVANQEVQDGNGHGTHCAGTACGPVNPGGVPRYGVASDAELYVGKVLSNSGSGSDRTIIAGLEWALNSGCQVISMSLGAEVEENEPYLEEYEDIGLDALRSGSLVIAAAGNESDRPRRIAPVGSPANCPSIFAVAAVDRALRVAPFSCGKRGDARGGDIDIAAPGDDVFSSYPLPKSYSRLRGTSMAAPHVAGIAALLAESDDTYRGLALWGALVQGRRFIGGDVADVGAGLAQAPTPAG